MSGIARESPWGPLVISDAHAHFFSRRFFAALVAQRPGLTVEAAAAQLGWDLPPAEPEALALTWAKELDRHGVSQCALMASMPGDEAPVAAAARACPGRFRAFAMVNPRAWNAEALSEIEVACLFPAMHRFSVQDDAAQAVFQWAERDRKCVFVHCGVLRVGVRDKLGIPSAFDLRYSNPVDLHAVALRYPTVPVIVPHFGAGYFREALMLADLCPNVYLDTSSSNGWVKYLEPGTGLRRVFEQALEVAGPGRLLFGTDSSWFPRGWQRGIYEEQARALHEIGASAADARAIFGENLLRILGRS